MEQQAEWLILIPVFQPVDAKISDQVCYVTFNPALFSHFNKIRVVVITLAREDIPIVKSGGITFQVPFPDHGCLVTRLLKQFGESHLAAVKNLRIIPVSVDMRKLPGQHHGPAGSTNGIGNEAVPEEDAFPCYAVNIWGLI
jgi:hypothetical protein